MLLLLPLSCGGTLPLALPVAGSMTSRHLASSAARTSADSSCLFSPTAPLRTLRPAAGRGAGGAAQRVMRSFRCRLHLACAGPRRRPARQHTHTHPRWSRCVPSPRPPAARWPHSWPASAGARRLLKEGGKCSAAQEGGGGQKLEGRGRIARRRALPSSPPHANPHAKTNQALLRPLTLGGELPHEVDGRLAHRQRLQLRVVGAHAQEARDEGHGGGQVGVQVLIVQEQDAGVLAAGGKMKGAGARGRQGGGRSAEGGSLVSGTARPARLAAPGLRSSRQVSAPAAPPGRDVVPDRRVFQHVGGRAAAHVKLQRGRERRNRTPSSSQLLFSPPHNT